MLWPRLVEADDRALVLAEVERTTGTAGRPASSTTGWPSASWPTW